MLTEPTPRMAKRLSAQSCYGIEIEAYNRDLTGLMLATGAAIALAKEGLAPSVARLFWQHNIMTAYVRLGASLLPVEAAMAAWSATNGEAWAAVLCTIGLSLSPAA